MKTNSLLLTICLLLITSNVHAQNIINTLGASGTYKIKDGTTDFLNLDQSTGNISLLRNVEIGGVLNSTITMGVITRNGTRFIHNYQAAGTVGFNTFIGISSGNFTLSGSGSESSYNTCVGYQSLSELTTGSHNSAFGSLSLNLNTSGNRNSTFGHSSMFSNRTGADNSSFGNNSLYHNTTGINNSAFGSQSLNTNTIGNNNSAFGSGSLFFNTGSNNSAFGYAALTYNSTADDNSAFGYRSLFVNTTGIWNSAFGSSTLSFNTTGGGNSAYGYFSLYSNVTGNQNAAFGSLSLRNNTTGADNSAFGHASLNSNTTGSGNSALGFFSLKNNTNGFQNTSIGHHSLENNNGNYNTALGYNAGSTVTTGANLTLIGIDANPTSPTAVDQITFGNGFVSTLRCNVQTITSLSDKRDKKNITELSLGLNFITKLKPRQFNWDKREWYDENVSDGSKMKEKPTAGFIAQELDETQTTENVEWLNLVLKDNPEKWEATPGNLLPIMVKAIQELSIKNEELKIKNEQLEKRLVKFEELQNNLVKKIEQIESNEQVLKVQIVNSENNN
jgi:hypothetical protein